MTAATCNSGGSADPRCDHHRQRDRRAAEVTGNIDNHGTIDVTTGSFPPTAEFFSTFELVNDGALVFDGSGYTASIW